MLPSKKKNKEKEKKKRKEKKHLFLLPKFTVNES